MKKFLYSLIIIGGFAFYALYQNRLGSSPNDLANISTSAPTSTVPTVSDQTQLPIANELPGTPSVTPPAQTTQPTTTPKPAPTSTPNPAPTPTPKLKGQYTDGQYTGNTANAYYGNIQVKVIISGGKITDVVFLQYPNDRNNSIRINTQAMPLLKAEAIAAQSANVDIVSGATDTSQAFQQSLASALTQAKS